MKIYPVIFLLIFMFTISIFGCSDMKAPSAEYALTHPFSTNTVVSAGTPQEEVRKDWGEPNRVIDMGYDDLGLKKEAWVYDAWFEKTPLDYGHFSRSKKIYFIGGYVTGYEDIERASTEE